MVIVHKLYNVHIRHIHSMKKKTNKKNTINETDKTPENYHAMS